MLHEIDLSRTDLNLLVLFETVMETRHVGRAAERLHLSPSAVSHGLGRLRGLLGDPLFLRTPRGMTPSARALELAPAVAEVLAGVRRVVASAQPFDPAVSRRRFTIGAPDGVSAVFLPGLLRRLAAEAPGIDVSIRQLMPAAGESTPAGAWRGALAELEARTLDIAVLPTADLPVRFAVRPLYAEDFVIAARTGHPALDGGLEAYLAARHLVVSESGDPAGFVDLALAENGLSRRVALTVPNFMFALAILAESDLVCALPARFADMHASVFGVAVAPAPVALPRFTLNAVAPRSAMEDAGTAWLVGRLTETPA